MTFNGSETWYATVFLKAIFTLRFFYASEYKTVYLKHREFEKKEAQEKSNNPRGAPRVKSYLEKCFFE